jgi:hypothetical protein
LPIKLAVVLTLKLPPSVLADDHAERSPVSKPSAKIASGREVAVAVAVLVGVKVAVFDGVKVAVTVAVAVKVAV